MFIAWLKNIEEVFIQRRVSLINTLAYKHKQPFYHLIKTAL